MGRDITLDLVANDDASSVLRRMSGAWDDLANETDQAGRAAGRAAGEFDRTAVSVRHLDRVIEQAERDTAALRREFVRTGDVDVFARIRNNDRVLRDLQRMRRGLGDLVPGDGEAEEQGGHFGLSLVLGFASKLRELPMGVGRVMTAVGPAAAPIAAGVGIALAGTLVVAMAGAMLAAGGGMGIALGIKAALKDPGIESAVAGLKATMSKQFSDIGRPFVKPLLEGIGVIKRELGSMDLAGLFAPMADAVVPVIKGIMGMIRSMLPGLRSFFESARNVVIQLAAELPDLGDALGDMFAAIALAGPNAITVFKVLFLAIESTARGIGALVLVAAAGMALFGSNADKAAFAAGLVNNQLEKAKNSNPFDNLRKSSEDATRGVDQLIESLDQVYEREMRGMNAESDFQAALDAMTESVKEHGRTMDLDTEAGRANQSALLQLGQAARDRMKSIYEETYATKGSAEATEQARLAYVLGRAEIVQHALAMGMNAAAAENLADKIMGIPPSRGVEVTANTGQAQQAIQHFAAAVAGIQRNVTVSVAIQRFSGGGDIVGSAGQGSTRGYSGEAPPRALGGPVSAGRPYVVGDGGRPELFVPSVNGTILPSVPASSPKLWGGEGGSRAAAVYNIVVNAGMGSDGASIGAKVVDALRAYERSNGAGWRTA